MSIDSDEFHTDNLGGGDYSGGVGKGMEVCVLRNTHISLISALSLSRWTVYPWGSQRNTSEVGRPQIYCSAARQVHSLLTQKSISLYPYSEYE